MTVGLRDRGCTWVNITTHITQTPGYTHWNSELFTDSTIIKHYHISDSRKLDTGLKHVRSSQASRPSRTFKLASSMFSQPNPQLLEFSANYSAASKGKLQSESYRAALISIFTVRRSLHGLSYRNSVRPSVRPSVCPSVTLVHCVHTVRPTTMISSPYGSPIILVSGISSSSQNSKGITSSEGVEWGWGGYELAIFDQ